jgi:hypothetical protein
MLYGKKESECWLHSAIKSKLFQGSGRTGANCLDTLDVETTLLWECAVECRFKKGRLFAPTCLFGLCLNNGPELAGEMMTSQLQGVMDFAEPLYLNSQRNATRYTSH